MTCCLLFTSVVGGVLWLRRAVLNPRVEAVGDPLAWRPAPEDR